LLERAVRRARLERNADGQGQRHQPRQHGTSIAHGAPLVARTHYPRMGRALQISSRVLGHPGRVHAARRRMYMRAEARSGVWRPSSVPNRQSLRHTTNG
jgi:hypothetical protein